MALALAGSAALAAEGDALTAEGDVAPVTTAAAGVLPGPPEPAEAGFEEELEAPPSRGPCVLERAPGDVWIDAFRRGIHRSVCASAAWFDGLFGDVRYDEELDRTHGRLILRLVHDERDGLEPRLKLRADFPLPNLDRRVDAFLGRDQEEEFVTGRDQDYAALPDFFRQADEKDWLVGLGYRPLGRNDDFDIRTGVKLRTPIEPFVQARYKRHWLLSERQLLRARQTVFWRNQHGFGDSLTLDYERVLGERFLLRWSAGGTLSEVTEGVDWTSGVTVYQGLGRRAALAYAVGMEGETDHEVPLERYGARVIFRQQLFREWLFGEVLAGVGWPKEPGEARERSFEVGVGMEIEFGRDPRRAGRSPVRVAPPPPRPAVESGHR